MPVYVVAYDLNNEGSKRPNILAEVRKTPNARLSESSYAIATRETVTNVHLRFAKHLDADDTFYVISLSAPWTGWGPQTANDFLIRALGPSEQGALHKAPKPRPLGPRTVRPRIPRS